MDECNGTNACNSENGTCTNVIGSYTCICSNGFTGNGSVCDSKSFRAEFLSWRCYSHGGVTFMEVLRFKLFFNLLDVNECETGDHDCHSNAFCSDFAGSWVCSCLNGFTGNGTVCTGEVFANSFCTFFPMYICNDSLLYFFLLSFFIRLFVSMLVLKVKLFTHCEYYRVNVRTRTSRHRRQTSLG